MRTGPFTFRFFSLAPRIRSAQTREWSEKMIRDVRKQTFWLSYIWEAMAQNSVYKSSGCISSNFYPHCSGLSFIRVNYSELLLTLLQRFDIAAGEGDADAVDGDLGLNRCLASVLESLHGRKQVINTPVLTLTFRWLAVEWHFVGMMGCQKQNTSLGS